VIPESEIAAIVTEVLADLRWCRLINNFLVEKKEEADPTNPRNSRH
jgi:hypothetical protein